MPQPPYAGGVAGSSSAREDRRWGGVRPALAAGRVVPVLRGAHDAHACGLGLLFRPGPGGSTTLGSAPSRRPDRPRPRYRQRIVRPRADRQPRLGRRRALRRQLPRPPLRPAPTGHADPARGARRPAGGPQLDRSRGRSGRCTSSRASRQPVRCRHQDPPRARRRCPRRRHRSGDPGHLRTARASGAHVAAEPEPSWSSSSPARSTETVRRPTALADTVRGGLSELSSAAGRSRQVAWGLLAAGDDRRPVGAGQPPERGDRVPAPLRDARHSTSTTTGASAHTLEGRARRRDRQRRRARHGGRSAARVAADQGREGVQSTTIRALVPSASARRAPGPRPGTGSPLLVDLPVGEASPVMRLHQVAYRMQAHRETGQAVGAEALAGLAGFSPPTLHSLGARVASGLSKRCSTSW